MNSWDKIPYTTPKNLKNNLSKFLTKLIMMIGIIHQKCQNKVFKLAKKAVAAIVIEFSLDLPLISFESG